MAANKPANKDQEAQHFYAEAYVAISHASTYCPSSELKVVNNQKKNKQISLIPTK